MEAVIGVGSNIDAERNVPDALRLLASRMQVVEASRAWRTPPVGVTGGPFLNAAVRVRTLLRLEDLARALRAIEAVLGREPGTPHLARPIDLDVLVARYAGEGWIVVQPRLASQPFHLLPLAELLPTLRLGSRTLEGWARRSALPGARPLSLPLWPARRPPRPRPRSTARLPAGEAA